MDADSAGGEGTRQSGPRCPLYPGHGSQIVRWPAGVAPANAVSAPSAPPLVRFQPVRASHAAITRMSAITDAGVARAPIPA